MLPKKNRLKKKKEFEVVFREGKSFQGHFFILKKKKNSLPFSRFAFVYPVKNEKKAVKRSKGKRIFREAVKALLSSVEVGSDIILIIKENGHEKNYEIIKEDIEETFKKIKILPNSQQQD